MFKTIITAAIIAISSTAAVAEEPTTLAGALEGMIVKTEAECADSFYPQAIADGVPLEGLLDAVEEGMAISTGGPLDGLAKGLLELMAASAIMRYNAE